MKPLDTEIKALTGKITHHIHRPYRSEENRSRNNIQLAEEAKRILSMPAREASEDVWNELSDLAQSAGLI